MTLAALSFRLAASTITLAVDSVRARLEPVHSNDPASPNYSFSKYTASAGFEFTITNPDAFDFLKPGVVYDLVMVPRDGDYAIAPYSKVPLADAAQIVAPPLPPVQPDATAAAGAGGTAQDLAPPPPAEAPSDAPQRDAAPAVPPVQPAA